MACVLALALSACGGTGGGGSKPPPLPQENPQFRAIVGVSMGAFGALNLGTKHADIFGTIGALGGPVDLQTLLSDTVQSGLEVKPQTEIPRAIGDDFTFDHLPPYPGRDVQAELLRDLVIAFGNPFLHHPDAERQYLASDSEPAAIGQDDLLGTFSPLPDPRGFLDGGDANIDGLRQAGEVPELWTDVVLGAAGTLGQLANGATGEVIGGREIADLNGDGIYDVGDALVVNYSEPFVDSNQNLVFEPDMGESYQDVGLDGVPASGDFGEANGTFDYDPDREGWLAQDPLTRIASRSAAEITSQRLYMDVGTRDAFGFARHYDNLVAVLEGQGVPVEVQDGFSGGCRSLPEPTAPFMLVRYDGGHVGIPDADDILPELTQGSFCAAVGIWPRLLMLLGFLNESFPDGDFGLGRVIDFDFDIDFDDFDVDIDALEVRGDMIERDIPSPTLQISPDSPVPTQRVLVYRPPKFSNSDNDFPIAYVLGGYGQAPEDYRRARDLLDLLIAVDELQNMYVVFLPPQGGIKGSFYVNHRVPEDQVAEIAEPTSGRFEDSIFQDLIPVIEGEIVNGRIRR